MDIIIKKIEFRSEDKTIRGILHIPVLKEKKPCIVIGSHGLEGSKGSAKQIELAKALPQRGIGFLRFDHRGCGDSEGNFIKDTSLKKRTMDMVNAVQYVLSLNCFNGKIALFGSSLGGSTCIAAWNELISKGIKPYGAVLCSALVKSISVKRIPIQANDNRPALTLDFFKKNLLFDLTDKISIMDNILIFHGDMDETVPVENAYKIYKNALHPKKLIIHKNGDHRMSSKKDQQEFLKESISWFFNCFS